jgi:hypothetical protein
VLILDSGPVSRLAGRSRRALALVDALREEGLWPPTVPALVLVECWQGHAARDAEQPYCGDLPDEGQQSMRLS